ncbi:Spy/CpxP family protein refolding chaperone [Gluconacetobacter aggeris]|uniref:Spy/CpxP family protein refolding chaperone n=2 Tax=Gluconacetobacter TaxID=89583 RepID=A0A7W4IQQ8_9PROT|nr:MULTISPECIES: Spy/CpxP family protein refolding chaperone [Gluconacetobacter]MBB2167057.1 Spy/CpxP family protein refolding chaperone [Gluconacetobacter aggeris]MBB2171046.1 Spy/CpxP family protein refolding chaperone [Gluconacetobacter asukensis]
MTVRRLPLIAALALLTTPALAAPDTTAPTATAAPGSAVPVHTPHDPSPDQLEAHIATLHQQLGITPAQDSAWNAFAQVMRDNAARFHDTIEQRRAKLATLSAPDNMQSYADLITQRAQDLQSLNMAFRTLYNGLSDAQKKTADTLFRQSDNHPKQAAAH